MRDLIRLLDGPAADRLLWMDGTPSPEHPLRLRIENTDAVLVYRTVIADDGEPSRDDTGHRVYTFERQTDLDEFPDLDEEEAEDADECCCAMTEASQRRCPQHGEDAPER